MLPIVFEVVVRPSRLSQNQLFREYRTCGPIDLIWSCKCNFKVQTRSLRTCTGLLSILTLAARGLSSFGEDHNTRSGRLIVSKGLSSSNFNSEAYIRNFADKDGKVWHGEGGQNLPPEAPHLVVTTYDIEDLLPKPPMKPAADAVPWAASPMEGFNGRVGSIMPSDDEGFDMYSYSAQTKRILY